MDEFLAVVLFLGVVIGSVVAAYTAGRNPTLQECREGRYRTDQAERCQKALELARMK